MNIDLSSRPPATCHLEVIAACARGFSSALDLVGDAHKGGEIMRVYATALERVIVLTRGHRKSDEEEGRMKSNT